MRFTYYDKAVKGYVEEMYCGYEKALQTIAHHTGASYEAVKEMYFASDCKLVVHTTTMGVVTLEEWWHYE